MRVIRLLKDRSGEGLPEMAGSIILWGLLLATCMSVLAAFVIKFQLNNAAGHVGRMIEEDGCYDTAEQQKVSNYLSQIHLGAVVAVSPAQNEYDLGESFTVTLSYSASLGIGGNRFTFPIKGYAAGTSEVYQK